MHSVPLITMTGYHNGNFDTAAYRLSFKNEISITVIQLILNLSVRSDVYDLYKPTTTKELTTIGDAEQG